jgi:hypothetical protein
MRQVPAAMQASLDAGTTTHCDCWRVERRDGAVFGFTAHDRDLDFAGLVYQAGSGFGGAMIDAPEGFGPQTGEVIGALDSDVLTTADIEAGLWAGAMVEIWRVDWIDTALRVKTWTGCLGEIRQRDGVFEAELLGPAQALNHEVGRVFARRCDAALGDARCGIDAGHTAYGQGCDQRFATCRDRFANSANFRGFPYMVGNDVLQAGPAGETVLDGSSRGIGQ